MKKIFTLIAATMMAVGAMAAAETIFDASASGWSSATLTSGSTTVGDVTWYGRGSAAIATGNKTFDDGVKWTARIKFGGNSTFKSGSTLAGVFTYTPTKNGVIKVYCAGGGSGTRTTYISQSISSTNRDTGTAIGSYASVEQAIGIAEATVEANQMVYIWADNNVGVYGITFEEVAIVATDPVFSLTKTEINQYQTSQIQVGDKGGLDGLTLSDLNYDNSVISVDTDGKITPVAAGTATITFGSGATEKYNASTSNSLTITVSNVTLDEQTNVTGDATWDWSQFGTNAIQLTTTTTPKKSEAFVLSNVVKYGFCDAINSGFGDAQALNVKCEYAVRDGKYLQGSMIKFNTTVPGTVAITFSSTGSSNNRDLVVNSTVAGSSTSTTQTPASSVTVAAGEVTIKGVTHDAGADADDQFLRFSKIVFTADLTGINNIKASEGAKAASVKKYVEGKQIVIEKNGKKYNVAGAEIK